VLAPCSVFAGVDAELTALVSEPANKYDGMRGVKGWPRKLDWSIDLRDQVTPPKPCPARHWVHLDVDLVIFSRVGINCAASRSK
jgi:hypothetical protein